MVVSFSPGSDSRRYATDFQLQPRERALTSFSKLPDKTVAEWRGGCIRLSVPREREHHAGGDEEDQGQVLEEFRRESCLPRVNAT